MSRSQTLFRQAIQNGHHSGVGEVALLGQLVVNLTYGHSVRARPQDAHDRVLKLSRDCHGEHAKAKIADYDSQ